MLKVTLLGHTSNPSIAVASSAKLCYSPSDIQGLRQGLTQESADQFVEMLGELGHESPMEHVNFTFGIEGVSRSLLAQITRHRMASFSVQSQRYVKEHQFSFVIPPEIEKDDQAKRIFLEAMEHSQKAYESIAHILTENQLKTLPIEEQQKKQVQSQCEKIAIEDARFVLPNGAETKMIVTMNVRSLHNFFHHRCCQRAQWEIRHLADEMLRQVYQVAPSLFTKGGPNCVKGSCSEGKMTCGKIREIQEKYKNLKK